MASQAQRRRRSAFTVAGPRDHRFLVPTDSYLPKGRGKRSFRYAMSEDHRKLNELDRDEHGLTPKQVDAFREVFNLFDINGGGTIDAGELDSALKAVEIHLTHQEIQDVLHVIDEDGNGEIDFNEFLTLMTSTERFLGNLRGSGEERDIHKESILFTALTKFMKKSALSSLSEIERYYHSKMRKSPHVVGHYAAGARLIGLTEKQMEKHMATLSVTGDKDNDSPYAQPLRMFTTNIPTNILGKRKPHGKIRLIIKKKNGEVEEEEGPCNYKEGESNNSAHPMPNINSPTSKKPASAPVIPSYKRLLLRSPKSPLRLQATSVPLPAVSLKKVQKDPNLLTIEDLPVIRERVQTAYKNYRQRQDGAREEMVHNSTFTDLGAIPSRTQQIQFKHILEAYSFTPTNVPPGLELQQLQPWHLVY